jgi:hypothetical protein
MSLVTVVLLDRLCLLEAMADISQELVSFGHRLVHCSYSSVAIFIGPDGGRVSAIDHTERCLPQGRLNAVLSVYSAQGSHRIQSRGRSPMKQRRYMAMTRLAASVWPSNYGWNAVVMWSWVPMSRISSRQNVEVNTGSRSETMDYDIPWRSTMSVKNICAIDSAEYG